MITWREEGERSVAMLVSEAKFKPTREEKWACEIVHRMLKRRLAQIVDRRAELVGEIEMLRLELWAHEYTSAIFPPP